MRGVDIADRIGLLRADRTSGASELVSQAAAILSEVLAAGWDVRHVGGELVRAQPSMAPMWNLVACALRSGTDPAVFSRYVERIERGPSILAQHGAQLLELGAEARPLQLVTFSGSRTVQLLIESTAQRRGLVVAVAEGRPALEGRRFAEILAARGIRITFYTDAALAQALDGADALVVGADAVSPTWFLNKSGTRMLAAAAAQQGVPVYVCATRDKFLSSAVAGRLVIRDEPADEIWPSPPPGVTVRNRYFERIPLDLVSAVVSDAGVLDPSMMPEACSSSYDRLVLNL
jgi:translation initiation factor 2B subunit (eIF-2B alpha/beta/delta family)